MRKTKIIATIGPKTETKEAIKELADAGMNIARINMSHGSTEWISDVMLRIKETNVNRKVPIAIMVDTQGPEIRTSATTEFGLEEGDSFKIAVSSACDIQEGEKHTTIQTRGLKEKVKVGDTILVDDGLIALEVLDIEPYHISCKVLNKGKLGKRKSVNLPGIRTDLPAITKKDLDDIKISVKYGANFVAQSFVRRKEDVSEMRNVLRKLDSNAMIIAKIEDQEGINNVDEIISEADAVMVARGDLGVEIPLEQIPIVQKSIVDKCILAGKPVIIATHLLESMIENPRPTRAEVTDVANAIFEKADCIMLSGETTKGQYPIKCVETMSKIANTVQSKLKFNHSNNFKTKNVKEALTLGACINAENLDARAIIVLTKTGKLLSMVSKNRPNIDIFAFTDNIETLTKLVLYWGAYPFKMGFSDNFDNMADEAIKKLKDKNLLKEHDKVVIVSDISLKKKVDTLEVREIE
jgi:pyruvate kinase